MNSLLNFQHFFSLFRLLFLNLKQHFFFFFFILYLVSHSAQYLDPKKKNISNNLEIMMKTNGKK